MSRNTVQLPEGSSAKSSIAPCLQQGCEKRIAGTNVTATPVSDPAQTSLKKTVLKCKVHTKYFCGKTW